MQLPEIKSDTPQNNPKTVPVLTTLPYPAMPDMTIGVNLSRKDVKAARLAEKKYDGFVAIIIPKPLSQQPPDYPTRQEFYAIGTLAQILKLDYDSPTSVKMLCRIVTRIRATQLKDGEGCILADVVYPADILPKTETEKKEVDALYNCLQEEVGTLISIRHQMGDDNNPFLDHFRLLPPDKLADAAVTLVPDAKPNEVQSILETLNLRERLEKSSFLLHKAIAFFELKENVANRVRGRLDSQQRIFMLHEQLKEIKQQLGDDLDTSEADVENFQKKIAELQEYINPEALRKMNEELTKLKSLPRQSPDYYIIQNYLSWLTSMPWKEMTDDILDVKGARRILDRDHYGLEDVKKRILEFIGVSKLKGSVDGSIICLVGPPGVGKTSLGRSIAEAIGRQFFRFSLGGMKDESEIKGHRRTYIGAQPGKIASALKVCGTRNPVIMLDEIDKLGSSYHGDPASALLEVLDPEQNNSFRDHFLDVPFDLSKVLFIATANVRDTIPAPLLDRMEIIQLPGYITEEKLNIAKKHLIPKQLEKHGLKPGQISFPDKTIRKMIYDYARDSGVRALENAIKGCMRKVAMQIAEADDEATKKHVVSAEKLNEFLGKPIYLDDPLAKDPRPGVAMGLAWTAAGGATLYIEVLATPGKPDVKITGQLGDVMKESSQIALSIAEKHASTFGIKKKFFTDNKLHIHVPAGATPKDGPSAGITITSAIISSATGKSLPPHWAMTGEITLTSRVLPVGGIKEKMIAAKRAGVRDVILPKDNEKDFTEINERVRQGLTPHFVSDYSEVYNLLF